jgi:hypothetical protein
MEDTKKVSSLLGDTYIQTKNDRLVIRAATKLKICWVIFIVLCGLYVYNFFIKQPETFVPGRDNTSTVEVPEDASFKKCDIDEINTLIKSYLEARVTCNQDTLKSLVSDPTEYDDMSVVESSAEYIYDYDNTTCYIVDGYSENEYIVIELSNISITDVTSKPLDVMTFYVVMNDEGSYVIDNSSLSDEQQAYENDVKSRQEIQDIYIHVKENIDYLVENDETFSAFYNKIYGQ